MNPTMVSMRLLIILDRNELIHALGYDLECLEERSIS